MSALVSHPTGNANLRAVLRALEGVGALSEFWTTVALPPGLSRSNALPHHLRRRLGQRTFAEVAWARTRLRPWREVARLAARRAGVTSLTRHETGWASVDGVFRALDRAVAQRLRSANCPASIVYAYEDGALETFRAAETAGVTRVYDLPTAHWRTIRQLLTAEAEYRPEWQMTMQGLNDSPEKLNRKDEEIILAEIIFVGSTFAKNSLTKQFKNRQIYVIPYGCPRPELKNPSRRNKNEPIQLFFAGRLTQPKGLADLIDGLRILEADWRLTIAGSIFGAKPKALRRILSDPRVSWLGQIPHGTLLEKMRMAHALVFPSILEGFGMVITEALSAGLPVITTPHTAGPDILTDGVDGYIVPIRSPEALADRITRLADDEDHRHAMARAALATAGHRSWAQYEAQIADLVTTWDRPA